MHVNYKWFNTAQKPIVIVATMWNMTKESVLGNGDCVYVFKYV